MFDEVARYERKPFPVDAIRVSEENMPRVASWCGGEVLTQVRTKKRYIKVDVNRPLTERQTYAFAGDWVLRAETGFEVYTHKAFESSFRAVA